MRLIAVFLFAFVAWGQWQDVSTLNFLTLSQGSSYEQTFNSLMCRRGCDPNAMPPVVVGLKAFGAVPEPGQTYQFSATVQPGLSGATVPLTVTLGTGLYPEFNDGRPKQTVGVLTGSALLSVEDARRLVQNQGFAGFAIRVSNSGPAAWTMGVENVALLE